MMAKRWSVAAALALGLALVTLGTSDRIVASTTDAVTTSAVDQQPDTQTLHCLREAAARFQRCRRQGGSTGQCTGAAADQFNACMGNDQPKPKV